MLAHPAHHFGARGVGQVPVNQQQVEGVAPHVLHQGSTGLIRVARVPHVGYGTLEQLELQCVIIQSHNAHGDPCREFSGEKASSEYRKQTEQLHMDGAKLTFVNRLCRSPDSFLIYADCVSANFLQSRTVLDVLTVMSQDVQKCVRGVRSRPLLLRFLSDQAALRRASSAACTSSMLTPSASVNWAAKAASAPASFCSWPMV